MAKAKLALEVASRVAPLPKPEYEMLNDMVLVQRIELSATSDVEKNFQDVSGVLSNKGCIISVSPEDTQLKKGDIVLFSEHAANDVTLDGEEYLLLQRKQVYLKGLTA